MIGRMPNPSIPNASPSWCFAVVVASAVLGLALMTNQAVQMSATYDEVTYLRIAAHWWRTGEQAEISRMGSPLTFWKLQQVPTLWLLDRAGFSEWVDNPIAHQEQLLPMVRIGELWIWLAALLITANWARRLHGPRAMAMASTHFVLSPNLLAHGTLSTMELPLLMTASATFYGFWSFLKRRRAVDFWTSAGFGGLAMSCKYTTILIPPILGLVWAIDLWLDLEAGRRTDLRRLVGIVREVIGGMVLFVLGMVVSNLMVTGFAMIPLSASGESHPAIEAGLPTGLKHWASLIAETPFPQDWVGFANQVIHQRNGGPSYLFGERRMTGWLHYYPVTLAVKVPLAFWLLLIGRVAMKGRLPREDREWMLPVIIVAFLLAAMLGSKRNYGYRYLLPLAVPAIVWTSAIAEGGQRWRWLATVGLAGMAYAVGSSHPHELSYFNELVGGPIGGRKVLSDSNLDWGQGAKAFAKLQRTRPEFRDMTLYYFGDTDPAYYGVEGRVFVLNSIKEPDDLPAKLEAHTTFVAVSASLQWGPWGSVDYFRRLDAIAPVATTDDSTIAIYRTSDLPKAGSDTLKRGPGPE